MRFRPTLARPACTHSVTRRRSTRGSGPAAFFAVGAALLAAALLVPAGPAGAQSPSQGAAPMDPDLFSGLDYRYVGPSRGGRVTAVAGHRSHPHTFYMGSTGGGIWKTTDYGNSWESLSDGHDFTTASIGAIQVADSDPSVVYVGTGSDGIRSNVIVGRGAYRSDDGGESWSYLGLRETGQIGAVEVHPEDPDLVYVAALGHPFRKNSERGVYRSRDGGESWEHVLALSDSVGVVDLELHPTDPEVIYAAAWRGERKPWTIISGCGSGCGDGIWKSVDGGDSWTETFTGDELPEGLIGKIDFAVSADDPDRVYALVEAQPGAEGLYRSDDAGESWRLVNDRSSLMTRPFYFTNVTADPTDADVLYVGNVGYYKSTDAGESFGRASTPHADNHDLWINPEDPDIQIQGNDGGANVTLDGGRSWSTQQNQPTAELYQVDVDDRFPYWLYAGQQDNSTISVPSLPPAETSPSGSTGLWHSIGGCETGPAVPKAGSDPLVVYANCKGRFGRFSALTGQEQNYWVGGQYMYGRNPAELKFRFQRTVPIEVSPHDPDVVYHGSQYVHRTSSGGLHWTRISPDLTAFPPEQQMPSGGPITRDITGEEHFSTLYVIEESPRVEGLIWTGSNDGLVHVTRDGGASWTDVTPEGLPSLARVNAIQPSPHDPATAYVAAYRDLLGDEAPYLFRTTDYGESWTRLADGTNGIPADHPVRVIREDPVQRGLLFAGTEFGMFVSFDDGARWQPFQRNLPVTPVTDIEIHRGDLVLSTMGRGFWILDDIARLRQLSEEITDSDVHLFRPSEAVRMSYRGSFGYRSSNPASPDYLPPGAVLDYYLAADADSVTLEVLNAEGQVVSRSTARAPTEEEEAGQGMQRPGSRGPSRSLDPSAGAHRYVWNLRHPGPERPETGPEEGNPYGRIGPSSGPVAAPGEFTVRLTADGTTVSRPLTVRIDPRVAEDGTSVSDLHEQLELNLELLDTLEETRQVAAGLYTARSRVEQAEEAGAISPAEAEELHTAVDDVLYRIVTREEGSYPPPMLIDQLEYLYGLTARADQEPGRDARIRLDELASELDEIRREARTVAERVEEVAGS